MRRISYIDLKSKQDVWLRRSAYRIFIEKICAEAEDYANPLSQSYKTHPAIFEAIQFCMKNKTNMKVPLRLYEFEKEDLEKSRKMFKNGKPFGIPEKYKTGDDNASAREAAAYVRAVKTKDKSMFWGKAGTPVHNNKEKWLGRQMRGVFSDTYAV